MTIVPYSTAFNKILNDLIRCLHAILLRALITHVFNNNFPSSAAIALVHNQFVFGCNPDDCASSYRFVNAEYDCVIFGVLKLLRPLCIQSLPHILNGLICNLCISWCPLEGPLHIRFSLDDTPYSHRGDSEWVVRQDRVAIWIEIHYYQIYHVKVTNKLS